MISIFKDNKSNKKRTSRKKKARSKTPAENDKVGREKLDRLHPLAFALLPMKIQENPNNDFLKSSLEVISERPHRLSDKWIDSINKWVDSFVKAAVLDPPEVEVGVKKAFDPMPVYKISKANMNSAYPMPAIICVDGRGWKWYFKTSKAYNYKEGDTITFTATISSHKEGITFLRRASKIEKVMKIVIGNEEEEND